MTDQDKLQAWLCLKHAPEVGVKTAQRIVEQYGSPESFVGISSHEIYRDQSLSSKAKEHLLAGAPHHSLTQILKLCEHYKIEFCTILDKDYPEALKDIFSPPLILYYRGALHENLDRIALGVVGTRKPSPYGKEMTKKLLTPLAERGVCIVSGLAMGIDTVAHQAAIAANGFTFAVLAGGLEEVYPQLNRDLAKKICNSGALISEYEPGSKMERWNFPARNRIISALSKAVFIVEGSISSGALLTAKFAIEQNRDVLALPGNINSSNAQGPNYLIKSGAMLISCVEDLYRILGMEDSPGEQLELFVDLSEDEQRLVDIFKDQQRTISFDELMLLTQATFGKLSISLLNLELKGLIAKSGGNAYIML